MESKPKSTGSVSFLICVLLVLCGGHCLIYGNPLDKGTVAITDVFGVERASLTDLKENVENSTFLEGSWHGHCRFNSQQEVKPRAIENFVLLGNSPQEVETKKVIAGDFERYFAQDADKLRALNNLQFYTWTNDHGTTRDFVIDPSTRTYFYQWKIPEYKNQSPQARMYPAKTVSAKL